ncbi:MAG TPA: universal stress protein [Solirubrobacteraceae bacterium]|nr:universal stress protein [Solirubrobacteraceae bacterium]
MFNTIVWATDDSPDANRALPYALALAARDGAALHAVHVIERFPAGRLPNEPVRCDEPALDARIKAETLRLAGEKDLQVTLHMPSATVGHVAERIAEIAQREDADLIVVGTRGHTAIGALVLGSVTQQLLRVAICPVLTVPQSASEIAEPSPVTTTTDAA